MEHLGETNMCMGYVGYVAQNWKHSHHIYRQIPMKHGSKRGIGIHPLIRLQPHQIMV